MFDSLHNPKLNKLFTLTNQEQEALSPVVSACLKVAMNEHEGQSRKKSSVDIHAVHHVIGAMKILQLVGIKDDITLGAALLHDVLEDGNNFSYLKYFNKEQIPELGVAEVYRRAVYEAGNALKEELKQELSAAFIANWSRSHTEADIDRADYLADEVADLLLSPVKQLTNPPIDKESGFGDHKRYKQVNSAYEYSPRSKRVKLAEICSTLTEDLLYPSGKGMSKNKLLIMHNRALTLCDMCKEVRPELFDLAQSLVKENAAILMDGASRLEAGSFNISDWITPHSDISIRSLQWVKVDDVQALRKGVISVALNEDGFVCAFRIMDDPGERGQQFGMDRTTNKIKSDLANRIGVREQTNIRIGTPSLFDNWHIARKSSMNHAVDLERFIAYGQEAGAINGAFAEKLRHEKSELLRRLQETRGEALFSIPATIIEQPVREGNLFQIGPYDVRTA